MSHDTLYQPGILAPVPALARYVDFAIRSGGADARPVTGAHRGCSPMRGGRLHLRQLGI